MFPEYISYALGYPTVDLELDDFFPDGAGNLTGVSCSDDIGVGPLGNRHLPHFIERTRNGDAERQHDQHFLRRLANSSADDSGNG